MGYLKMKFLLRQTQLLFALSLLLPLSLFSRSQEYQDGYRAYIQSEYGKAIEKLSQASETKNDPEIWYYIGKSYLEGDPQNCKKAKDAFLKAYKLDSNVKRQKKFRRAMADAEDCLKAERLLSQGSGDGPSVLFIVSVTAIIISGSLLIFIFLKRRANRRSYREHEISEEVSDSLTLLNQEFISARDLVNESDDDESKFAVEEIEERCISLNDKLEELKYGIRNIDEESFKDEIEITRDMIRDCLDQFQKKMI